MNLQDLGAIGEMISAIAVIASVLYLAVQIRHGLHGYQSVITQETTNHFSRLQLEVASDEKLSEILWRSYHNEELNSQDTFRLNFLLSSYMISYENMYYQSRTNMLSVESYLPRRVAMAALLATPAAWRWWQSNGSRVHPKAFADDVNAAVAEFRTTKTAQ
jgi:hypothetical protein